MTRPVTGPGRRWRSAVGAGWRRWVQRASAAVVAGVAAYASYDHQALFARVHGARGIAAAVWPLSVDGLVVLACVALLDPAVGRARPWVRFVVRAAFVTGVGMSLVANVAAADRFDWAGVAVAGWPPVALLLAVEILMHSLNRDTRNTTNETANPAATTETDNGTDTATDTGTVPVTETAPDTAGTIPPGLGVLARPAGTNPHPAGEHDSAPVPVPDTTDTGPTETARAGTVKVGQRSRGDAHRAMWAHYQAQRAAGRTPTGAELDRIAGTRDYGRAVLARWRRTGRIPATDPADIPAAVPATVPADSPAIETTTPDLMSLVDTQAAENGGESRAAA
jgi:hypothetical protein